MILTHVGGPTLLVEVEGWRLLTDPTFDPAGGHYAFGWGTSSDKTGEPAVAVGDLPAVDAVLLTHDHHDDNLDRAGRRFLATVGTVVTTAAGARRLAGPDVRGLVAGESTRLVAPGRPTLVVTATPARHGPPLSRPVAGDVVGFAVRHEDADDVLLWVTGDTVPHARLDAVARTLSVDVLVVHAGGVRFGVTGPLRYTMTGREAVALVEVVRPRVAVPVHYEGWSHFRDGVAGLDSAIARADPATRARIRRLVPGTATDVGDGPAVPPA